MSSPKRQLPEILQNQYDLAMIDNVYQGSKTSTKYLERFVKETDASYDYRTRTATLLNYFYRTVKNTQNLIFRKPLSFDTKVDKATQKKANQMGQDMLKGVVKDGHVFVVTDTVPTNEDDNLSNQNEPYSYLVERKDVLNYRKNDHNEFTHITIRSTYEEETNELVYVPELKEELRVFVLIDGKVQVHIHREDVTIVETEFTKIPVHQIGFDDLPLLDLAKINLNHFNRRSELNRYLRIAAVPVPVFYGVQGTTDVTVGVDEALTFNNKEDAGFEFVELGGKSVELLQDDLRELEKMMATLAISLIDSNSQQINELQVQAEMQEDESFLGLCADKVQEGLNLMFEDQYELGGEKLFCIINKDFSSNILSPEETEKFTNLYLNGVISQKALLELLVKGEVLPNDFDVEKQLMDL